MTYLPGTHLGNFLHDYVNETNRQTDARLECDTRTVVIDDEDAYEVPRAALEGV